MKEKFRDFMNIQESEGVSIAFKLPSGKNTTFVFHKDSTVKVRSRKTFKYLCSFNLLLILSAHAREGYSSHFVCHSVSQSVCVSLFDFGEGAVFRVETYISTF